MGNHESALSKSYISYSPKFRPQTKCHHIRKFYAAVFSSTSPIWTALPSYTFILGFYISTALRICRARKRNSPHVISIIIVFVSILFRLGSICSRASHFLSIA